jgi:hypothetical protein
VYKTRPDQYKSPRILTGSALVNRAHRKLSEAVKHIGSAQKGSAAAPSGHNVSRYPKRLKATASSRAVSFLEYFLRRKQPV